MDTSMARTAIVTGAARGIGRAVSERLLSDGFNVALVDSDGDTLTETCKRLESPARTCAITADVRDAQDASEAVTQAIGSLGPPTVLVNNAGYTRDNLLFKMTESDWDDVMDVHLKGPFLMTRAVQSTMVERQWGRIINVSSVAALGNRGQANYSAAKSGIQGFTKTLAIELGQFGVTANAIAPGFTETAMTHQTAERMCTPFEELKRMSEPQIPLRRIAQPDDIANVVSFLAGDDSRYVSGQVIYIAGGPEN